MRRLKFVINIVTEDIAEAVNTCSGLYEKGANEFVISGLTAEKSRIVKPFRVRESPIQFECRLHKMITISEEPGGSDAIFGEVIHMHIKDELITEHKIDVKKLKPVAKLAGPGVVDHRGGFQPRPSKGLVDMLRV